MNFSAPKYYHDHNNCYDNKKLDVCSYHHNSLIHKNSDYTTLGAPSSSESLEGQNVRNFPYPVRIRWSRQPNLVPFYLYNRIFECPENIRNDGFPDVRWPSKR